jgi:hypothetical protein
MALSLMMFFCRLGFRVPIAATDVGHTGWSASILYFSLILTGSPRFLDIARSKRGLGETLFVGPHSVADARAHLFDEAPPRVIRPFAVTPG